MTQMTVRPAQGTGEQGIPGISAAELYLMQTAAASFLGDLDPDPISSGMQTLMEPAHSQAGGKISARRDHYERRGGIHWMFMQYHAE